jgi:small subunit ribosomal protein S18
VSEGTDEAPSYRPSEGGGARPAERPRPRRPGGGGGRFGRRRVCSFCVDKVQIIDYKEAAKLRRYISDRGKIEPRRKTGNCARHQRMLTTALKRARHVAILPFTAEHIHLTGVFPTRPDRFERRDRDGGGGGYGRDRDGGGYGRDRNEGFRDNREAPENVDRQDAPAQE